VQLSLAGDGGAPLRSTFAGGRAFASILFFFSFLPPGRDYPVLTRCTRRRCRQHWYHHLVSCVFLSHWLRIQPEHVGLL